MSQSKSHVIRVAVTAALQGLPGTVVEMDYTGEWGDTDLPAIDVRRSTTQREGLTLDEDSLDEVRTEVFLDLYARDLTACDALHVLAHARLVADAPLRDLVEISALTATVPDTEGISATAARLRAAYVFTHIGRFGDLTV